LHCYHSFAEDINVSVYDKEGILQFSELTNDGKISKRILRDYIRTDVDSYEYYENYTIDSLDGINLSDSTFGNYTFLSHFK
jgi:hypothetical protein